MCARFQLWRCASVDECLDLLSRKAYTELSRTLHISTGAAMKLSERLSSITFIPTRHAPTGEITSRAAIESRHTRKRT